jgi:hypothetical protein
LLPVEKVLHADLRGFQLLHLAFEFCNKETRQRVRGLTTSNKYPTS